MKKISIFVLSALSAVSCSFLDIVPDNIPTMDMTFQTRNSAEKMLYTCYNYIPSTASPWANPGIGSSDEVWNCSDKTYYYKNETAFRIAKGLQNTNDPYLNYWSGGQGGSNLFVGIRDCNIFLENVDKVPDMQETERERWRAEVKFIKAYLHIWLFQLYGPIPFVDENIPVDASPEEVKVVREPVDDVVAKIVALLDEAIGSNALPEYIRARDTELGRITKPGAMAIKARLLTYAASPLFNGNEDFAGWKDAEGRNMINPEYDATKWELARDACKEAIDAAIAAGHELYEFDEPVKNISDTTRLELTLRHTLTKKFSDELLWGLGRRNTRDLLGISNAPLTNYHLSNQLGWVKMMHNPTLEIVEEFYTRNGLPIDEDKEYDYKGRYDVIKVPHDHKYYADTTARTSRLHLYREPRFYAWVGFDNGKWFNMEVPSDENSYVLHSKSGDLAGRSLENYSATGFYTKKLVSYELVMTQSTHTGEQCSHYAFPIIRLSDLYLLYAECLNECKDAPDEEVYEYIQKVRNKAGLDRETGSLAETWARYSTNPDKPKTKDGMRDIIQRERMIELAFEGQRFYDLRRWKLALDYCNRPVRGWSVTESDDSFYTPAYIEFPTFTPKNYFWPIKLDDLYRNNKLQQSYLW
ncbi:MAG: RagB/SusD family nutrient uptake outer membrane protein [Candidatus Cryptobacteroides sp.]